MNSFKYLKCGFVVMYTINVKQRKSLLSRPRKNGNAECSLQTY